MTTRHLAASFAILGVSAPALHATTLFIPSNPDTTATHYFAGDASQPSSDTLNLNFSVSGQSHLKDYNMVEFTASAPAGQAWKFTLPPGVTAPYLQLFLITDYASGYAGNASPPVWTFNFAQGGLGNITSSGGSAYLASNGGMSVQVSKFINGTIAITSFTADVTYNPALIPASPNEAIGGIFNAMLTFNYTTATDPGILFTLVPEPGSAALVLLGVGCYALRRFRQRGVHLPVGSGGS